VRKLENAVKEPDLKRQEKEHGISRKSNHVSRNLGELKTVFLI